MSCGSCGDGAWGLCKECVLRILRAGYTTVLLLLGAIFQTCCGTVGLDVLGGAASGKKLNVAAKRRSFKRRRL